jgi:hypothetical protein
MRILIASLVAFATVSAPALADDKWVVQPIQTGTESARFVKGVPTVELEMKDGIARITPLPLDHGMLSFTVAVYNDGERPMNFGIENVAPASGGRPVRVLSKTQLVKKAQNRAFWSQFGLAMLGGVAAGAAASQRDYYTSTFVTPRGTYRSFFSAPSVAGQWQAAGLTAGTVGGIALIQLQLDRTIQALGDEIVQTTTVDPGESYAGRIVLDKFDPGKLPSQVVVQLNWNGEAYPFTFQIAKPGTAAPVFTTLARASNLRDRRPRLAMAQSAPVMGPHASSDAAPAYVRAPHRADKSYISSGVRCITCH